MNIFVFEKFNFLSFEQPESESIPEQSNEAAEIKEEAEPMDQQEVKEEPAEMEEGAQDGEADAKNEVNMEEVKQEVYVLS